MSETKNRIDAYGLANLVLLQEKLYRRNRGGDVQGEGVEIERSLYRIANHLLECISNQEEPNLKVLAERAVESLDRKYPL